MTCEGEEELGRAVLHSHRRKLFERVRPGCVHVHVACHVMLDMSMSMSMSMSMPMSMSLM